jgi:hypothetical protein
MATSAIYFQAYRDQADLDVDDAIALLMDFLGSYGLTDTAVNVLCEYIDEEGMTEDFSTLLKENGLVIEAGDVLEQEEDDL